MMTNPAQTFSAQTGGCYLVDSRGVGYRDRYYRLVIPWSSIDRTDPVALANNHVPSLKLLPEIIPVVIEKTVDQTDGYYRDCPLVVEEGRALLLEVIPGDLSPLVAAIMAGRAEFYAEVELSLSQGHRYGAVAPADDRIRVPRGFHLEFPQFCPVTGEVADAVVEMAPNRKVLVSAAGARRQRYFQLCRPLLAPAVTAFHLLLGMVVIFGGYPDTFPLSTLVVTLPLYLLIPLGQWLLRDRITIETVGNDELFHARDPEWMQALWELNATCFPGPESVG